MPEVQISQKIVITTPISAYQCNENKELNESGFYIHTFPNKNTIVIIIYYNKIIYKSLTF